MDMTIVRNVEVNTNDLITAVVNLLSVGMIELLSSNKLTRLPS